MRFNVPANDLYAKIGVLSVQVDELSKLVQSLMNENTALKKELEGLKETLQAIHDDSDRLPED